MNPKDMSASLKRIASYLENDAKPSKSVVVNELRKILSSVDKVKEARESYDYLNSLLASKNRKEISDDLYQFLEMSVRQHARENGYEGMLNEMLVHGFLPVRK